MQSNNCIEELLESLNLEPRSSTEYRYSADPLYQPYIEIIKRKVDELADRLLRRCKDAGLLTKIEVAEEHYLSELLEQKGDEISGPSELGTYSKLVFIADAIKI